MKRDMELIKKILIETEKYQNDWDAIVLNIEGYTLKEISFNVMLLEEAGYLKCINLSMRENLNYQPIRLTWEGYEFLEASKNEEAWNKTKALMAKSGGFVVDIAKSILTSLILQQLTGGK